MLCPLFFLIKINKGDIRAANPPLSANTKRFDLSVIANRYDMWIAYYVICDWIDDLTTKYWQLIDTLHFAKNQRCAAGVEHLL